MNKFKFISHILENHKMNASQKERFFKLVSKEIGAEKSSNEAIWKEIENIKKQLPIQEKKTKNFVSMDLESEYVDVVIPKANKRGDLDTLLAKEGDNHDIEVQNSLIKDSNSIFENSKDENVLEKTKLQISNNSGIRYAVHKNLPAFLRNLNANDYTKYLTHSIDSTDISNLKELLDSENYDFEKHLIKIKQVFEVLTEKESDNKKYFPELHSYYLPRGIYTKIKNYIHGETWSLERKIKMHWSHSEIKEWTIENLGKAPSVNEESLRYEGFYFQSESFNKYMSFCDLILFFKNEIHIRNTNSLFDLINNIYNDPDNTFKESIVIENNVPDNLDFYTDVEKLKKAITLILGLIIEKHGLDEKPKVIFEISINDEITLSILHEGNIFKQNKGTLRYGKTFANLIKLLNGVCKIDLLAKFSDSQSYHLKLWEYGDTLRANTIYRDDKPLRIIEKLVKIDEKINGVLYKLTFNRGL